VIEKEEIINKSKTYSPSPPARPTRVQYTEVDAAQAPKTETGGSVHKLWRGIDAKLDYAQFHFDKASEALIPPRLDAHMLVAIEASGAIIGHEWQRPFFADFDAFLSATKNVPEIIRACFGKDLGSKEMQQWFEQL
jgi:hypothetical protein